MKKLAILVLGRRNAGKSTIWYNLFGSIKRTGKYPKPLRFEKDGEIYDSNVSRKKLAPSLVNGSPEERGTNIMKILMPFLVNGSAEERGRCAEDMVLFNHPLVLCSVQYIEKGLDTIQYFIDNEYDLKVFWLNPGFKDSNMKKQDHLQVNELVKASGGEMAVYDMTPEDSGDGKDLKKCVDAIKDCLLEWQDSI